MKRTDTISAKMMQTLHKGKKKLSPEARQHIRQYIESQRMDSLFFMNKSREADIYYTVFGLMLSYIFGLRTDWKNARRELDYYEVNTHDLVHYAAYVRSSMLLDVSGNKLWRLFFPDKDPLPVFRTFPHNDSRSPYSRFIWLSLMEDLCRRIDNKQEIVESLDTYRIPGGGYTNNYGGSYASSNATAAALSVKGQLGGYRHNRTEDVQCLYDWQDPSGGFCTNAQAPLPDILSTAIALFVLQCYDVKPRVAPASFIEAHWLESGGFAPTLAEENSDIEYTFYGLLALGTC
jgi:hypothetical protein